MVMVLVITQQPPWWWRYLIIRGYDSNDHGASHNNTENGKSNGFMNGAYFWEMTVIITLISCSFSPSEPQRMVAIQPREKQARAAQTKRAPPPTQSTKHQQTRRGCQAELADVGWRWHRRQEGAVGRTMRAEGRGEGVFSMHWTMLWGYLTWLPPPPLLFPPFLPLPSLPLALCLSFSLSLLP